MRVLVTGAGGFLGRAVVERLLDHGQTEIRCLVRRAATREELDSLARRHPDANLEVVVGNLLDVALADHILRDVSIVFHLAASMKGSAGDMFLNTVVGSKNLLEAMKRNPVDKVVMVSSFAVYGVAGLRRGSVVDENTPVEQHPGRRDPYSHAKWRQERLFHEYQSELGFDLVVLRPGVIYGPGGAPMSARVGLDVFGLFLHLGGRNVLPLAYVDNCAEAIVVAGSKDAAVGEVYNVHDDDLPTCREYLRGFRRSVAPKRYITVPYWVTRTMSWFLAVYHRRSQGQLPDVFTPYKTANIWKTMRFDNTKLKRLGWRQLVPTDEGLRRTFGWMREHMES